MLNRDTIFGTFQPAVISVDTPVGRVYIRNLSEAEYSEINRDAVKKDGKPNPAFMQAHRRRLVAAVVCDEHGKRLLDQPGDVERLNSVHAGFVSAVYTAAVKHCGLGAEEDAEKNSDETSGCDSHGD